ncbi:MAG: endonuclease I [Gammaproteobacteria bacterium]|nr:endonuclease I [Gammaproteobacteria bacterium]
MKKQSWILIIVGFFTPCNADQTLLLNIGDAEKVFWSRLYPNTHYTLYCGERFTNKTGKLTMGKVYPVEWIIDYLGCDSLDNCRKNSLRFNRIEADLHNLYPMLTMIERARKNFSFGEIPGEFREFFECDFEHDVRTKTIEPRIIARGNIARSLFYMHWEYGLPLNQQSITMLIGWHAEDPPSYDEKRRNNIIEKIQGTRNSFIDNPNKATQLSNMIQP